MTGYMKDSNPDWLLLVTGNPRISEVFYGYSDNLSLDNNSITGRVERIYLLIWDNHLCSR